MYLHLIPRTTKRKHKTSLEDTDIGKDFLKRSPTALEKINKWCCMKFKVSAQLKKQLNEETTYRMGEKVTASYSYDNV